MAGPRCDRNHPLHVQHAGVPPLQVREHLLGDQHGQQLRSAADVLNDGQHVQGQNELGTDRDEAESIWNLIVFDGTCFLLNIFSSRCDTNFVT